MGINRNVLHKSVSSFVKRCKSVVFSLASFKGAVPLRGGTEYLGLSCDDGAAETLVLPSVNGPFVGVEVVCDACEAEDCMCALEEIG